MEHQKDNRNTENKVIGQSREGYDYILRKAEKLTTALYLVTDILSDKEPMKWKAREAGVDVLSDITVGAAVSTSEKMSTLRVVLKKIEKLVSFLDVAASTHMMSEMNASMLRKEYLALKDNVEAEWNRTQEKGKMILTDRFFEVPRDLPDQTLPPQGQAERSVSVAPLTGASKIVPQQSFVGPQNPRPATPATEVVREVRTPEPVKPEIQKEIPRPIGVRPAVVAAPVNFTPRPVISDSDVVARSRPDVTRDDRRKIILALIKQKPAITVGDIAKSIPGVSEKTIQRELLAMVSDGVLIKRGERRWSTYSLRDT